MKKTMLITVLLLVSINVLAQISGGIRLGLNVANQKAEEDGDSESGDSKLGFVGGLYMVAPVSEKVAIQPELFYSAMGSRDKDLDIDIPFNYLSIPVFIRFNLSDNVNLHVGPQFGLLLSAEIKDDTGSLDMKDYFKGTDFGVTLGAGFDMEKFNAGLRYYLGVANVLDDSSIGEIYKNSAFQVFVGYRLFGAAPKE